MGAPLRRAAHGQTATTSVRSDERGVGRRLLVRMELRESLTRGRAPKAGSSAHQTGGYPSLLVDGQSGPEPRDTRRCP